MATRLDDLDRQRHEAQILAKLDSEGLSLRSSWGEIRRCFERTVLPRACLEIAARLRSDIYARDRFGIWTDEHGYARDVQCNIGHGGNRRLALNRNAYECSGCLTFYSAEEVRNAATAGVAYTGGGGLAGR